MTIEIRTLTGNVTADPELRFSHTGKAVTDVRVAVNHRAKTDEGEWIDAGTDFYTIPIWERDAENAASSLRKGTRITVTGQVHRRAYTDSDGVVHVQLKLQPLAPIAASLDFQSLSVTKNPRSQGSDPQ